VRTAVYDCSRLSDSLDNQIVSITCYLRFVIIDQAANHLMVWLSGNALASINVVALHQTRLVPGWMTVCGRVNHLGM